MRVCIDNKDDPYYDPRPRRVWVKDIEVMEPWSVADELRRVVVLASGAVLNGAVFIERLKGSDETPAVFEAQQSPNVGFAGTSIFVPDEAPAPAPEAAPEPKKAPTAKHSSKKKARK